MAVAPFPPVAELLPHAAPALLLDAVLRLEEGQVECVARIGADFPYLAEQAAPALALVELMAQATGVHAHLASGEGRAPFGYVVGIRNARFFTPTVRVGTELRVRARLSGEAGTVGRFHCDVLCGQERLAEAELTVFRPSRPSPGARLDVPHRASTPSPRQRTR